MSAHHEKFIRVCLQLAEQAKHKGNHPFGAILVKDGEILLRAENRVNSEHDCTRHAELNLVSQASKQLSYDVLRLGTLYTSTEPCAMCAGAIYWAGIPTLVFGCSSAALWRMTDVNLMISSAEIFATGQNKVQVIGPILEDEALSVHQGFW